MRKFGDWILRHRYVISALVFASAWKLILILVNGIPFNSDEAIVALMARHILGGERPIFFYGQAYMGSLDAYLVAGAFAILGEGVWQIRIVQIILYCGYMLSLWFIAKLLFRDERIANISVWLITVPTVLVTTYTTATLGGYNEILLLGNLSIILGYKIIWAGWDQKAWAWLLMGLLAGLGFWTLGLISVYIVPIALLGLWRFRGRRVRFYALAALGFFIGSLPWWIHNFLNNGDALAVLTGTSRLSLETSTPLQRIVGLLVLGIPTLLGFRFPWSADFVSVSTMFLLIVFYLVIITLIQRIIKERWDVVNQGAYPLTTVFVLSFLLIFIGSHFGIDATGRYFLPLNSIVVLVVALVIGYVWQRHRGAAIIMVLLPMLLNGLETCRAVKSADKLTTQFDPITRFDNSADEDLIQFLEDHAELRGYTNYWVSFRLAFLSQEEIIYSAHMPYKADLSYTPNDRRYPQYDEIVVSSEEVAIITSLHPELDKQIVDQLRGLDVSFADELIGPYHVFYDLSRKVEPGEFIFTEVSP